MNETNAICVDDVHMANCGLLFTGHSHCHSVVMCELLFTTNVSREKKKKTRLDGL